MEDINYCRLFIVTGQAKLNCKKNLHKTFVIIPCLKTMSSAIFHQTKIAMV